MGVDPPFWVCSEDSTVFQLHFGLKHAHLGHCSTLIRFVRAPDEALCLVRHTRAYLDHFALLRQSNAFFVTTVAPFKAASRLA